MNAMDCRPPNGGNVHTIFRLGGNITEIIHILEACCTSGDANQWPEGTVGVRVRPEAEKSYWKIEGFVT